MDQINSTANPSHLPQNLAKLAKSAVLFSWELQNGSQDFDFFNCHGMGAEYLSYVKSIATFALTFYGYIISILASALQCFKLQVILCPDKHLHIEIML